MSESKRRYERTHLVEDRNEIKEEEEEEEISLEDLPLSSWKKGKQRFVHDLTSTGAPMENREREGKKNEKRIELQE